MSETLSSWLGQALPARQSTPLDQYSESFVVHEGESLHFSFRTWADWPNADRAALITVRVEDSDGNEVEIPEWPSISRRHGQYKYVAPGSEYSPARTGLSVLVPAGGVTLTLTGRAWRREVTTSLAGPPAVTRTDRPGAGWRERLGSFTRLEPGTSALTVEIRRLSGESKKGALRAAVEFIDEDFGPLLPAFGQPVDRANGTVTTFTADPQEPERYTAQMDIPEGATHIRWRFAKDEGTVSLHGAPQIDCEVRERDTLDDFLADLRDGQPLILIDSTAPPLGSGTITIRPNNLANMYASFGIAVISVGFGRLRGNRRRQSEYIFQAGREEMEDVVAAVAGQGRKRRCIYVCSSFASTLAVGRTDFLKMHSWSVLYEIRDNMEEFNRVGYSKWYSPPSEVLQCLKSDKISTVSPGLAAKVAAIAPGCEAVVSPNAIMTRFVEASVPMRDLELVEERRLQGIVGYVGHLTDAWFDWHRYLYAASQLPSTRFELVGPGVPEYIKLPSNVTYYGAVKQDELAAIAQRWAVGVIPFIDSPLTLGVDPNKLFEYCAWGLRTVSARMGSIDDCPTAVTYSSAGTFVSEIERALARPWLQEELDAAAEFLTHSTWRTRAVQTLELMGMHL